MAQYDDPLSLKTFLAHQYQPVVDVLGKGIMVEEGKAILYGHRKLGKSVLAYQLGYCFAHGIPWLGLDTPSIGGNVLYVQVEISNTRLQIRMKKTYNSMMAKAGVVQKGEMFIWTVPTLRLDQEDAGKELRKWIALLKPNLIILDPVYKLISRPGDPDCLLEFQDYIDVICREFHAAVLLVAHPRKGGGTQPGQAQAGSNLQSDHDSDDLYGPTFWADWADSVMRFSAHRSQPVTGRVLTFTDLRHAEEEVPNITLKFDFSTLWYEQALIV